MSMVLFFFITGINDVEWEPISRARSEEPPPEPWMKAAMDTLNKELLRQGTRIQGWLVTTAY